MAARRLRTPVRLNVRAADTSKTAQFDVGGNTRSLSGSHVRMHHLRPSSCYACSHRSLEAKHEFKRSNPCPSAGKSSGACRGYVIDHVQALNHVGGAGERQD